MLIFPKLIQTFNATPKYQQLLWNIASCFFCYKEDSRHPNCQDATKENVQGISKPDTKSWYKAIIIIMTK